MGSFMGMQPVQSVQGRRTAYPQGLLPQDGFTQSSGNPILVRQGLHSLKILSCGLERQLPIWVGAGEDHGQHDPDCPHVALAAAHLNLLAHQALQQLWGSISCSVCTSNTGICRTQLG